MFFLVGCVPIHAQVIFKALLSIIFNLFIHFTNNFLYLTVATGRQLDRDYYLVVVVVGEYVLYYRYADKYE